MFPSRMLPGRLLVSIAAVLAKVVRWSPATLAKSAYLLAFAVIVGLLAAPPRSHAQMFRGVPARPAIPTGVPFTPILPVFSGSFTGFQTPTFMPPAFPASSMFPTMPGAPFQLPLSNFGTDSTGFFGFSFFPAFGGFFPAFGGFFPAFGGFNASFLSPFGFSSVGLSGGLGMLGMQGGFGFSGFGGFNGFGGFGGFTGFGLTGGFGGFAGKGFGGFNGRKAL
jgi:hypothetical protein